MSRRKQANPQHLRSDQEPKAPHTAPQNAPGDGVDDADSGNESRSSSEETHVCEKCCAEFFKWSDFSEHQKNCRKHPLVLIMSENEVTPASQVLSAELSPALSCPSDLADFDDAEGSHMLTEADASIDGVEKDITEKEDESMEVEGSPEKPAHPNKPADSSEPTVSLPQIPSPSSLMSYTMPNTNVILEALHGTRVAVAQFSQSFRPGASSGSATVAIPMILDKLMSLQQQQMHQLQLIEQIRSQVAVMNGQPVQFALSATAASQAPSLAASTGQLRALNPASIRPLQPIMSCAVNGQASLSLTPSLERSQDQISQSACEKSSPGMNISPPVSTNSDPSSVASPLLPPYAKTSRCSQPLNSNNLAVGQGDLLSASSDMPLQPQCSSSSVIFPNPLASIAATANALDPLSALVKHRKGKPPNVSIFDTKATSEDPFFKHKCRFCAKVFGSDSALQIHLRSHTGERPFKCNICGNRFSTKGNLKVHFQRHKEKYPHIQMNPYPVPEYLDNVPTSSGIPYGMSFPPEKPVTTWLDSKPVLPTIPTSVGLQLPPSLPSFGNYSDSPSLTPLNRSPQRPSPTSSECTSLSPNPSAEQSTAVGSRSPQANVQGDAPSDLKPEGIHLPANCIARPEKLLSPLSQTLQATISTTSTASTLVTEPSTSPSSVSSPVLSMITDQFKAKFPFGGALDSMQTSETSKLQQLVENIDKKITDPNQCVICHRVLSCQSALKMHYRIHTGERPFKCKVCGRAFTTKGNLKTHFGVHRAKPPLRVQHSCPICQKKFTNAVVLQQHIRMHMGGQIPNTPLLEDFQDMDLEFFDDKDITHMSNNDDELIDDNSLEDDVDLKEGDPEHSSPQIPSSSTPGIPCPPSVISHITALDNQMKAAEPSVNLNHSLAFKSMENGVVDHDQLTNDSSSAVDLESQSPGSPAVSDTSSSIQAASPSLSHFENRHSKSPVMNNVDEVQEIRTTVKCEKPQSPSPAFENGALDLTAVQLGKPVVKEESPFSMLFLSKEHGPSQSSPSLVTSTAAGTIKIEVNGHSKPISTSEGSHLPFGVPAVPENGLTSGMTSMLIPPPPPPRRTPKQHNCNSCGKNFSSASALQIHERTHTGEKPFGCSICGRAFTTKGNLKVHMGTHMWNNAPARRGRRLSVENPMTLLGGDAMKFSEMFQKDFAVRAMNIDPSFWNQYAAAITNGLAMKNNEISVIQNRGIPPLPVTLGGSGLPSLGSLSGGIDRAHAGKSPPIIGLEKTSMDARASHPFSRFIEDDKEIGIN